MTTATNFDFAAAKASIYEMSMYVTEINRLNGTEEYTVGSVFYSQTPWDKKYYVAIKNPPNVPVTMIAEKLSKTELRKVLVNLIKNHYPIHCHHYWN